MKGFTGLIILILLCSCSIQNHEFLEFESSNSMIIGKETNIKLIPTFSKKKKNVIVEIFHNKEYLDKRRIRNEKYEEIINLYQQISVKDSSKTVWLDPPTIKITYIKGGIKKEFHYIGIPKENEKFHQITKLILESAKLTPKDID